MVEHCPDAVSLFSARDEATRGNVQSNIASSVVGSHMKCFHFIRTCPSLYRRDNSKPKLDLTTVCAISFNQKILRALRVEPKYNLRHKVRYRLLALPDAPFEGCVQQLELSRTEKQHDEPTFFQHPSKTENDKIVLRRI